MSTQIPSSRAIDAVASPRHAASTIRTGSATIEAMPVPSARLKTHIAGHLAFHASQRWPQLEEIAIVWRGGEDALEMPHRPVRDPLVRPYLALEPDKGPLMQLRARRGVVSFYSLHLDEEHEAASVSGLSVEAAHIEGIAKFIRQNRTFNLDLPQICDGFLQKDGSRRGTGSLRRQETAAGTRSAGCFSPRPMFSRFWSRC